jgi:hypothetical protein
MKHFVIKILTATVLISMILALSTTSTSLAQKTEWQAQPMYLIKAAGINPNAIGQDNP